MECLAIEGKIGIKSREYRFDWGSLRFAETMKLHKQIPNAILEITKNLSDFFLQSQQYPLPSASNPTIPFPDLICLLICI